MHTDGTRFRLQVGALCIDLLLIHVLGPAIAIGWRDDGLVHGCHLIYNCVICASLHSLHMLSLVISDVDKDIVQSAAAYKDLSCHVYDKLLHHLKRQVTNHEQPVNHLGLLLC